MTRHDVSQHFVRCRLCELVNTCVMAASTRRRLVAVRLEFKSPAVFPIEDEKMQFPQFQKRILYITIYQQNEPGSKTLPPGPL